MYNISDIVHTHRLLFTCNYELCILYSIAHYSRTYIFFTEVRGKISFPMHTGNIRTFLRTGQLRTFRKYFLRICD